ncbi:MAG: C40 family peptidase [Bacteroidota bacterium]
MRKLLTFLILLGLINACSNIYIDKQQTPQVVEIPEDYRPNIGGAKVRMQLQKDAERLIGVKYKYGGTTPKGFDCSGFTGYVYNKSNIDITRSSQTQAKKGIRIKVKDAQKGDLVFFTGTGKNKISHVAMVISNDHKGLVVVHSTSSKGVRKDNVTRSSYWNPKILFARRILD